MVKSAKHTDAADLFRAWWQDKDVILLDTETTGPAKDDQVIELAMVTMGGEVLFDSLIRPTVPIKSHAQRIHGLSMNDLQDKPRFADCAPAISAAMEGRTVIAYNVAFDKRMLMGDFERAGLAPPSVTWACAAKAYKRLRPDADDHKLAQAVRRECGDRPQAHRALDDVRMLWILIRTLAEESFAMKPAQPVRDKITQHSPVDGESASAGMPVDPNGSTPPAMPTISRGTARFTAMQKIDALRREIEMRRAVYPGRVGRGISAARAQHEIAVMEAVLADYQCCAMCQKSMADFHEPEPIAGNPRGRQTVRLSEHEGLFLCRKCMS